MTGYYSCLFLTAPTVAVLQQIEEALRPEFEASGTTPWSDFGACRTFVVRIETSGTVTGAPRVARRAAAVAYGLGATRVDYFHEAMEQVGPLVVRRRHPISVGASVSGDTVAIKPPLFGGDRDDRPT